MIFGPTYIGFSRVNDAFTLSALGKLVSVGKTDASKTSVRELKAYIEQSYLLVTYYLGAQDSD